MSPFTTLGVASNCAKEVAQAAYRKLAMQHHPDRGGDQSRFQEIQAAWDQIDGGYRDTPSFKAGATDFANRRHTWEPPQSPGGTWRDRNDENIFQEFKSANRAAPNNKVFNDFKEELSKNFKKPSDTVAHVTIRQAFAGFNLILPLLGGQTSTCTVNIPPGIPNGHTAHYKTSNGSFVLVTVRIVEGDFHVKGLAEQDNLFSAGLFVGDIERDIEVDALDLITGAWLQTTDFLGEKLDVRIPAGFNPLHRLKVAGKGYYGWLPEYNRPSNRLQDMYLRLKPIFKKPADIDPQKIINLYNSIDHADLS